MHSLRMAQGSLIGHGITIKPFGAGIKTALITLNSYQNFAVELELRQEDQHYMIDRKKNIAAKTPDHYNKYLRILRISQSHVYQA